MGGVAAAPPPPSLSVLFVCLILILQLKNEHIETPARVGGTLPSGLLKKKQLLLGRSLA